MNKAKLFKNGNSQAVRLPREFKFQGDEIYVKRIGKLVVLIPEEDPWGSLVQSLDGFSDDFLEERKQPQMENREPLG